MDAQRPEQPAAGMPATQLLSFAPEWAAMSRCIEIVERLPGEAAALQERYGRFDDDAQVDGFVAAVDAVHRVAARLGGPQALARRLVADPDWLSAAQAPPEVYAQLAWLARQIGIAAHTLGHAAPWREPGTPSSATERAARLRWALAGSGGLAKTATDTAAKVAAVRATLAPLSDQFLAAMQAFHASQLLNSANVDIGRLGSSVARLQEKLGQADAHAGRWWRRGQKNEALLARLEAERAQMAKKQALVDDTAQLFSAGNAVVPALARVDEKLRVLAKVFADAAERLDSVAQASNREQLGDAGWLETALDLPAAAKWWGELGAAARDFVRDAAVAAGSA